MVAGRASSQNWSHVPVKSRLGASVVGTLVNMSELLNTGVTVM